jgi:transposase
MVGIRHVGVDCSETEHRMVLLSRDGEWEARQVVSNEHESIQQGFQRLLSGTQGESVRVVLESVYGFSAPVAEVSRDLGLELWQVNSKALDHYRDLEGQPRKDDDRDAFLLGRMSFGKMQGCQLAITPEPEAQRLRRIGRLHTRLTRTRGDFARRMRSRLVEVSPEIVQKNWQGPKWSSRAFLAIMRRWPGFEGLQKARQSTIERVLGQHGTDLEQRPVQAQAIKVIALRLPSESEVAALEITCLVAQLDALDNSLKQVDQQMKAWAEAHAIGPKLQEMAGVGPFTAATLVGEVLPLAREASEAKVATYTGLTPLSRFSREKGRSVLARGVNKHALHACYMSAVAAIKTSALDRAYYRKQKLLHQGHPVPHVVAILALARQRMKVMYKLMTTDARYDKEVLIASHLKRISTDCGNLAPLSSPGPPTFPPAEGMENHPLPSGFPPPQPTTSTSS